MADSKWGQKWNFEIIPRTPAEDGEERENRSQTSALYFTNHSTALYCKGPDLKQVRAPSFLMPSARDFLTIRSWTMNENKNDVPAADDGRILVGYLTCLIDGSPKDPIPVYVTKDGEPLPGWFKMRVSGVIEADGRYRAYDGKPRFDAVDIKDAIKPENASKPE
jgi:hypothetical protein